MPVSCENSDSAISSSIRDSLGNYNGITKASNLGLTKNQLSAALKQSLLKTIEYVESPPGFGFSIQDTLKAKYTILRPSEEDKTTTQSVGGKINFPFIFHGTFRPSSSYIFDACDGNIAQQYTHCFFLFLFRSVFLRTSAPSHRHIQFILILFRLYVKVYNCERRCVVFVVLFLYQYALKIINK